MLKSDGGRDDERDNRRFRSRTYICRQHSDRAREASFRLQGDSPSRRVSCSCTRRLSLTAHQIQPSRRTFSPFVTVFSRARASRRTRLRRPPDRPPHIWMPFRVPDGFVNDSHAIVGMVPSRRNASSSAASKASQSYTDWIAPVRTPQRLNFTIEGRSQLPWIAQPCAPTSGARATKENALLRIEADSLPILQSPRESRLRRCP